MDKLIEQKLSSFFEKWRLLTYKKGEMIYRPGEVFNEVGFVKSGYVRLYVTTKEGKEITFNLFKPVFYLSLGYAKSGEENRYFFEAVTETEIWRAPKKETVEFIEGDRQIANWLNDKLLHKLGESLMTIETVNSGGSYNKIAAIILSLAKSFGRKRDGEMVIDFETTHRVIASLAGVTRETASVQIKKLENEGLIRQTRDGLVVVNSEKLKERSAVE